MSSGNFQGLLVAYFRTIYIRVEELWVTLNELTNKPTWFLINSRDSLFRFALSS
jgi:hypothetical protein